MSIFEYDEERELALLRADEREAGKLRMLVSLVRKKYSKGMKSAEIAELLEENIKEIDKILKELIAHPNLSDDDLTDILLRK